MMQVTATLRKLEFACSSRYNSLEICLSGMQEELIDGIMDWCNNVDHDWQTQIMLLTVVAGAKKSAIAHTIVSGLTLFLSISHLSYLHLHSSLLLSSLLLFILPPPPSYLVYIGTLLICSPCLLINLYHLLPLIST